MSARILVTRPAEDGDGLVRALAAAGLMPLVVPAIVRELIPMEAVSGRFDLLLCTSSAAVASLPDPLPDFARVAAVGPATAESLARRGLQATVIGEGTGEQLVDRLRDQLRGARVLFPRAEGASATAARIRSAGADLVDPVVYRTVPALDLDAGLEAAGPFDAITLLSPSAAFALKAALDRMGRAVRVPVIAIGPTTAAAWPSARVARRPTVEDVVVEVVAATQPSARP